ncbi:DUF3331 domain-containing protein [Burkholderia vietnamiensis]|nr:DUF3331 domain-containing protein [Burkholderia vietnamiensis]
MPALSDENIVVRVLLNVLEPSGEQLDACAGRFVARRATHHASARARAIDAHCRPAERPANVEIVTRISATAISVSWSGPCLGRCTEQVWGRAFAADAAVCALTGREIQRGEPVYRPHAGDARFRSNQDLAILAAMVKRPSDPPRAESRS